jgi:hypothetical protein
MSVQITSEVTLDDIDETISHINEMLKTDEFGNRMTERKKEMLQLSIDDLLDARLNLVKTGKLFPDEQS